MDHKSIYFSQWSTDWLYNEKLNEPSMFQNDYQPWICSIIAASLIGIVGILPLAFISHAKKDVKKDDDFNLLQLVLSFAVGSLLADVFLHLLPEAWNAAMQNGSSPHEAFFDVGLSVLFGIFLFIVVEMLASHDHHTVPVVENNNTKTSLKGSQEPKVKVIGYLNLIANGIDNFAHGLAVAGSFLVSYKTGLLTTAAILIHEIPHELGDFAILLNSGFTRWEAAKAQLYTASIGLVGAVITLILGTSQFLGGIHTCILGFTAGGFLNIALITVLPELMQENRPSHSAAQFLSLLLGLGTMASVAFIGEV